MPGVPECPSMVSCCPEVEACAVIPYAASLSATSHTVVPSFKPQPILGWRGFHVCPMESIDQRNDRKFADRLHTVIQHRSINPWFMPRTETMITPQSITVHFVSNGPQVDYYKQPELLFGNNDGRDAVSEFCYTPPYFRCRSAVLTLNTDLTV
ncbi:uncharacterized protein BCR38DRAFT_494485 [Pseudomassariella vexata]|uniref:Uncharacterized protein n=1 Tax=Pseudomassariella vexata TaxID=1141098 RepID=A0A1Y2DPW2_9PEZI|nr:uncharacterized protein BCR38DRAFT_494485 [Pseudomassariella vexata]ORY61333.1 hypothetical protein BCR38DRAFT_494485 [Pseudomassariella vexata]